MWENSASLIPSTQENPKAFVLGVEGEDLSEMDRLLRTLGVIQVGSMAARIRDLHPGHYFGKGKLDEAKLQAAAAGAEVLVLDVECSPNQLKNIEAMTGLASIDRPGVILEIFSRHARTKEAKMQVELARVEYLLPRLSHYWSHFERQRGGGVGNRGMGEKQIEVDRRLLRKRCQVLRERLRAIEKTRNLQRRSRNEVFQVSLVGYTNAGKSTLLNAMTASDVLVENKLFSTLDSRTRALNPEGHPPVVVTDTVGFIRRIPTGLVASFRSTLEELRQADLLLHVVDASSSNAREQLETTNSILQDLAVDSTPTLVVMNKCDLIDGPSALNWARTVAPGAQKISAQNPDQVRGLRQAIMDLVLGGVSELDLVIPLSEGRDQATLRRIAEIHQERVLEPGGLYFRIRVGPGVLSRFGLERYVLAKRDEASV